MIGFLRDYFKTVRAPAYETSFDPFDGRKNPADTVEGEDWYERLVAAGFEDLAVYLGKHAAFHAYSENPDQHQGE